MTVKTSVRPLPFYLLLTLSLSFYIIYLISLYNRNIV